LSHGETYLRRKRHLASFKPPAQDATYELNAYHPGHGRPVIGDPNPPPSYNFKAFTLNETFIGTIHLIRSDHCRAQPCPQAGGQYFPITVIGYDRCEHF
jgi:hypothetical protein